MRPRHGQERTATTATSAEAYTAHPALLRLSELETLRELGRTANARLYIDFDHSRARERTDPE
jgi:hypothetical protein